MAHSVQLWFDNVGWFYSISKLGEKTWLKM